MEVFDDLLGDHVGIGEAEALTVTVTKSKATSRKAAETWLRDRLADGPVDQETIREDAQKANIAERTLWRAKASLKIRSIASGFGKAKRSMWSLPAEEGHPNDCHSPDGQGLDSGGSNWEEDEMVVDELAENAAAQLLPAETNDCQPANTGDGGSQCGTDDSDRRETEARMSVESDVEKRDRRV